MDVLAPENLDLASLPWVPFAERKALPPLSAVYFAVGTGDTILYIGKTTNLRMRWNTHHKTAMLEAAPCLRIAWMACDASRAAAIEWALIQHFMPPYPHGSLSLVRAYAGSSLLFSSDRPFFA